VRVDVPGLVIGALGLAILDGIVSRPSAAANVGGVLASAGKAVKWFLSPQVPAFTTSKATKSASSAPAGSSTQAPGPINGNQPPAGAMQESTTPTNNTPPALAPAGTITV
jgi:hypothetical protein